MTRSELTEARSKAAAGDDVTWPLHVALALEARRGGAALEWAVMTAEALTPRLPESTRQKAASSLARFRADAADPSTDMAQLADDLWTIQETLFQRAICRLYWAVSFQRKGEKKQHLQECSRGVWILVDYLGNAADVIDSAFKNAEGLLYDSSGPASSPPQVVTRPGGEVILEGMTDRTRALLEQAKTLSEEERETLAYQILQTVGTDDQPLSPEWREEIERRIKRAVSGEAGPGLDWRKAMNEIRSEVEQERDKGR
ncbi:MAG: addiction module protein [Planctomycetota bacterium]